MESESESRSVLASRPSQLASLPKFYKHPVLVGRRIRYQMVKEAAASPGSSQQLNCR